MVVPGLSAQERTDTIYNPPIVYSGLPTRYEIAGLRVTGADNYEDYIVIGYSGLKVGDEVEITAQVNNLGEGMLYNVNARVEGKHVEKQETYIGNIDTGKSGNVDLLAKAVMVTDFEEMAKPEDWIIVTYEDRNGNKHSMAE